MQWKKWIKTKKLKSFFYCNTAAATSDFKAAVAEQICIICGNNLINKKILEQENV